jgi:hypothetical protein
MEFQEAWADYRAVSTPAAILALLAQIEAAPDGDSQILAIALKAMTAHFNALVGACMDAKGNPLAPDRKALMVARGYLPASSANCFNPSVPSIPAQAGTASAEAQRKSGSSAAGKEQL